MLEKEIERVGIPSVLVTALPSDARMLGANRIVQGAAIRSPFGDAGLSPRKEAGLRRRIVCAALGSLLTYPEASGYR